MYVITIVPAVGNQDARSIVGHTAEDLQFRMGELWLDDHFGPQLAHRARHASIALEPGEQETLYEGDEVIGTMILTKVG